MGTLVRILILLVFASPLFGQFGQTPFGHVTAAAAGFLPTDLGNLQLWFRASSFSGSDGSVISTNWLDESGNSNDATVNGTPTLELAEINGEPTVRFDGSTDYFDTAFDTTQFISCYVVYNAQPTGHHSVVSALHSAATVSGWNVRTHNTQDVIGRIGDGVTQTADVSASGRAGDRPFEIVSFLLDNSITDATWYIDGVSEANTGAQNIKHENKLFAIGSFFTNSMSFLHLGDIAEVIVYNVYHNSANQDLVETYLTTKYNL